MTDNEIIKELNLRIDNFSRETLDLINRQNAEIERLEKKANTPFAKFTFDENKLKEIVADAIGNIEFNLNSVKSEAIKEFAERYRKEIFSITHFNGYVNANLVLSVFNDILKEMTEVSE